MRALYSTPPRSAVAEPLAPASCLSEPGAQATGFVRVPPGDHPLARARGSDLASLFAPAVPIKTEPNGCSPGAPPGVRVAGHHTPPPRR